MVVFEMTCHFNYAFFGIRFFGYSFTSLTLANESFLPSHTKKKSLRCGDPFLSFHDACICMHLLFLAEFLQKHEYVLSCRYRCVHDVFAHTRVGELESA